MLALLTKTNYFKEQCIKCKPREEMKQEKTIKTGGKKTKHKNIAKERKPEWDVYILIRHPASESDVHGV